MRQEGLLKDSLRDMGRRGKVNLVLLMLSILTTTAFSQQGWGPDVKLTNTKDRREQSPKVACSGSFVYVVWYEEPGGTGYCIRSTDNGETWGVPFLLYPPNGYSPSIAASDNFVHVAWDVRDGSIWRVVYRRSTDFGGSWGRFDTIRYGRFNENGRPRLAVAGDTVYLLMMDYTLVPPGPVLRKSKDRGTTWDSVQTVAQLWGKNNFTVCHPIIHVVTDYFDRNNISMDIYYTRSTDGGRTWTPTVMVSDSDSAAGQWPDISSDWRGNPHITWGDHKYSPPFWPGDIFYAKGLWKGSKWIPPCSLTVSHSASAPSIVSQGDTLHLAWEDDRARPGYNTEIYYRMSTDLGRTWGKEMRLTFSEMWSNAPDLAIGNNILHLVWGDDRDSTMEIYYKQKKLFPSGFENLSSLSMASKENSLQVFPNPGRGSFWIYDSNSEEISIYNITGKLVRRFVRAQTVNNKKLRGFFLWNGRDSEGKEVRSGIYFIKAEGEFRKVVLIR